MKKLIALLSAAALLFTSLPAHAEYEWLNRSVSWSDGTQLSLGSGVLYKSTRGGTLSPCFQYSPIDCTDIGSGEYLYSTVLAACEAKPKFACIQKVQLVTPNGQTILGKNTGPWQQLVGDSKNWDAGVKVQLPTLNTSNLYSFEGKNQESVLIDISPKIHYRIIEGIRFENYLELISQPLKIDKNIEKPTSIDQNTSCIEPFLTDHCYVDTELGAGYKLKLELLVQKSPKGWVNGRILNPDISFSKKGTLTQLNVAGGFLATPSLYRSFRYANAEEYEAWNKINPIFGIPWDLRCGGNDLCSAGPALNASDIDKFVSAVSIDNSFDTATSLTEKFVAGFSWTGSDFVAGNKICKASGYSGFVGSNALTYESALPSYDIETQSISYRIASPHYMPDGKEFDGVYELQVSRALADCIWGIGTAHVKASVTVLSDDGTEKVRTSVVRQKGDYVAVSIYGFDYSAANLNVKFTKSGLKKSIITCVSKEKPIKTKKVTGYSPKCPTGYKKK